MEKIYDQIYLGKRKTSIARLKFYEKERPSSINKKDIDNYFASEYVREIIYLPFKLCNVDKSIVHFKANVHGGGVTGQAIAIQNAIARFLVNYNQTYKPILKKEKMLTFDLKRKERKKCGLKKARKAPQFSKR